MDLAELALLLHYHRLDAALERARATAHWRGEFERLWTEG